MAIDLPPPLVLPERPALTMPAIVRPEEWWRANLPGMMPFGGLAGLRRAPRAPIEFLDNHEDTSGSTFSWNPLPLGLADPDLHFIVAASRSNANGAITATVSGVSATEVTTVTRVNVRTSLFIASVPTVTSATVQISLSGANRSGAAVWLAYLPSATPHAFDEIGADPISLSVAAPAGGILVAYSCGYNAGTGWSGGIAPDFTAEQAHGIDHSGGFISPTTATTYAIGDASDADWGSAVAASWAA